MGQCPEAIYTRAPETSEQWHLTDHWWHKEAISHYYWCNWRRVGRENNTDICSVPQCSKWRQSF